MFWGNDRLEQALAWTAGGLAGARASGTRVPGRRSLRQNGLVFAAALLSRPWRDCVSLDF